MGSSQKFDVDVLTPGARAALRNLCLGASGPGRVQDLDELEHLGLVSRHLMGWQVTWSGFAVNNWHRQLECALHLDPEACVPAPEQDENGEELRPDCRSFRETFFRPGWCWCRRRRSDHLDQVALIAQEWLDYHNQDQKRLQLQLPSQRPRCLEQLRGQLSALQASVLQGFVEPGFSVELGELALRLAPLCDYFALKEALDRLLELELLVLWEGEISATWEGRRLARWLSQ